MPHRPPRVAMVGAGQLARMTQRAAIDRGVELHVLAPSDGDPAVLAGARLRSGRPDDLAALRAVATGADVVTFDHEHAKSALLRLLESEGVRLAPSAAAKRMAQDKHHARERLRDLGFPVPPFTTAATLTDVARFAEAHGWPVVAKAPTGGYDGRGVTVVEDERAATTLLRDVAGTLLLEPLLPLQRELAVLTARSASGETAVYPVAETVQHNAMCREVLVPAPITKARATEARELALAVTEAIGAVGVTAVELFVTDGRLLVNELAVRPHNSGHFTIEGAETSQFEQHLRAVLGWPLGVTALTAPAVAMVNVVGPDDGSDPRERLPHALGVPGAHIHLYDKAPAPGRKLGHVTARADTPGQARETARRAAEILEGGW
jgi:5-(carboxyamino)imidazole ribonucleotide synthase